jgi:hypothetical protein
MGRSRDRAATSCSSRAGKPPNASASDTYQAAGREIYRARNVLSWTLPPRRPKPTYAESAAMSIATPNSTATATTDSVM